MPKIYFIDVTNRDGVRQRSLVIQAGKKLDRYLPKWKGELLV
ncbi:MAG: hypothetical protein V3S84_00520 [Dehalococcoidales bacterium]